MSLMKRIRLIFSAKANKALDRAEDPRETLDYSYQKQLELLQKVRKGVADVATSRKRIELQMNQLQQQADKLTSQAQKALGDGSRGPRPRGADPQERAHRPDRRPAGPARPAAGRGGEAHPGLPAAPGQGRGLPHQEGDDQGLLQRRAGPDPDQRGVLRHLRGDGRRRHGRAARRGQDRADAGPRGRHRRADRLRRPRRRLLDQRRATTSAASSRRCPPSPMSSASSRRSSPEARCRPGSRPRRSTPSAPQTAQTDPAQQEEQA